MRKTLTKKAQFYKLGSCQVIRKSLGQKVEMFSRHGSRINKTDQFPKGGPKMHLLAGFGVCSTRKFYGFELFKVPFPGLLSHSDRMLAHSVHLGWSLANMWITTTRLISLLYWKWSKISAWKVFFLLLKTCLLWKIWPIFIIRVDLHLFRMPTFTSEL